MARRILEVVDPTFFKRVDWVPAGQVIQVKGNVTIAISDNIPTAMETKLMQYMRKWIMEIHPTVPEKKTIVWYKRKGPNVHHGRIVEESLEQDLIAVLQRKMEEYDRPEQLVIYDGQMSFKEQFKLFRSANVAVGPHGSGLANVLWMDQSSIQCEDRPKVLEFLVGPGSDHVQLGGYGRTYYLLYSGLPIEYHHIHYTAESTSDIT